MAKPKAEKLQPGESVVITNGQRKVIKHKPLKPNKDEGDKN
jgi:hypothetical protein